MKETTNGKKKLKLLFLAIIIISVILLIKTYLPLVTWVLYSSPTWEFKVKDFAAYKGDFETLVNLAYREFNKGQDADPSYGVSFGVDQNPDGTAKLYYFDESTLNSVEIKMSQKEQASLKKVTSKAFQNYDHGELYNIRVYKNQVSFETENGLYSLIYTKDGYKPKFVSLPSEKGTKKIKKISDHWYDAKLERD